MQAQRKNQNTKTGVLLLMLIMAVGMMMLSGCSNPFSSEDASGPDCPVKGDWFTNTPDNIARLETKPPTLYGDRFDAKLEIDDWDFVIHTIGWENSGICSYLTVGFFRFKYCDFKPAYTGEKIHGTFDHESKEEADGRIKYYGTTKDGDTLELSYNTGDDTSDKPGSITVYFDFDSKGKSYTKTMYP